MPYIDLSFPIRGNEIPVDHGYSLYSSISRIIPHFHQLDEMSIHPVRGRYSGNKTFILATNSMIKFRFDASKIPEALLLTGKTLDIDGHLIQVGIPRVYPLKPAANLSARLVTIKGYMDEDPFYEAIKRQMDQLNIKGKIDLVKKRYMTVQDKKVVGFQVRLLQLNAEESILVQEHGLGGKHKMGCGVFSPMRNL